MARDFLTGLPRAPQLIGLPAASKQGAAPFRPPIQTLTESGFLIAPAGASNVVIDVYTPGGGGGANGRGGGGGGAFGRKTRACLPGEIIPVSIDQGLAATADNQARGGVSVDGMVGVGGRNGGDPGGGAGGTITGGDENRTGGAGAAFSGVGGGGGSAAGPGLNGIAGTTGIGAPSPGGLAGKGGDANSGGRNFGGGGGGGNVGAPPTPGGIAGVIGTFS